ncbi:threonine/serine exporter family protein [uncultured Faecalibaculum sp.]|uniref:threonine/serine exporter family protein n=1 Tax=uncultured Faecalibaculum sp. TaxID=1729681 RepID=UPI0025F7D655|nr:threonine/serine exporter family protein [uncultured Faecalibaculum sp.]
MSRILVTAAGAFLAASMYAVFFDVRRLNIVTSGVIAGVAAVVSEVCRLQGMNETGCAFVTGLVFAGLSEVCARLCRTPVTTYLPSVLMPFVPGRMMLYMVGEIVQGQQDLALQRLIEILSIAGALALAILIMGTLFGLMSRSHTVMRKKLAARDSRQ